MSKINRWDGVAVSPSEDANLFNQMIGSGLFKAANIVSLGSNQVSVPALQGIMCGRDFKTDAEVLSVKLPQTGTATGYLYIQIDINGESVPTFGSALGAFTPVQEDINNGGSVYQMLLAIYVASATAISSITNAYSLAQPGAAHTIRNMILYASNWNASDNTYTILDSKITKIPLESVELIGKAQSGDMTDEQIDAFDAAIIMQVSQENGSLVIKARGELPTIDLPITMVIL